MPIDFRASQLQTNKIIASGSTGTETGAQLVIYPHLADDGTSPNQGFIDQSVFVTSSIGTDIFLYVSGGIGERNVGGAQSISVFGGDVYVSGNMAIENGFSASLQQLPSGIPYLLAGPNVTITTNSLGQVEVSSSGGGGGGGGGGSSFYRLEVLDYYATNNTSDTTAGQVIFPANQFTGSLVLHGVIANSSATATGSIRLYNVTSGSYVHIGGPGNQYLSVSGVNPAIVSSVDLISASNFNSSSQAIYELQVSSSNGGSTAFFGGFELRPSGSFTGISYITSSIVNNYISGTWEDGGNRLATTSSVAIAGNLGTGYFADNVGADVFFYVSGSSGSKDTATPGVAVFGGDVVISGVLYGGSPLKISGGIQFGNNTVTTGDDAFSGGAFNIASGPWSFAVGAVTTASNIASFSAGVYNIASGIASFAQGFNTTASNNQSHSEGNGTVAVAEDSHAEGRNTITLGRAAHAEGYFTTGSREYSHAEGYRTVSSGNYSHAEGYQTVTSGTATHTEGFGTIAQNDYSHAEGYQTITLGYGSHAEGFQTTTFGLYSHAEGLQSYAHGDSSHAEGRESLSNGIYSHAEGYRTTSSGQYSHAEGYRAETIGIYSHAEGYQTTAVGQHSHTEGFLTVANDEGAHAEGAGTTADGQYSHSEGESTFAEGNYSHAEGHKTYSKNIYSHAEGYRTTASADYSHAGGYFTIASGSGQTVIGKYNSTNNDFSLFVVGDGTSDGARGDIVRVNSGSSRGIGKVEITGSFSVSGTQSTFHQYGGVRYFPTIVVDGHGGTYNIDSNEYIVAISCSTNPTVVLPKDADFGRTHIVKDISGSAGDAGNFITVVPQGTDLIDGAGSSIIGIDYGSAKFVYFGFGRGWGVV
jgi:hypothetical protein